MELEGEFPSESAENERCSAEPSGVGVCRYAAGIIHGNGPLTVSGFIQLITKNKTIDGGPSIHPRDNTDH